MAASQNYAGPATLISGGAELAIEAVLRAEYGEGLSSWAGYVTGNPGEDFWSLIEEGAGTLRLPDGREGQVVPTQTEVGSGRVWVTGSGPAPF